MYAAAICIFGGGRAWDPHDVRLASIGRSCDIGVFERWDCRIIRGVHFGRWKK
jgi:hypothetical protein